MNRSSLTFLERLSDLLCRRKCEIFPTVAAWKHVSVAEGDAGETGEGGGLRYPFCAASILRRIATIHGVSRQSIVAGNSWTDAEMSATIPETADALGLRLSDGCFSLLVVTEIECSLKPDSGDSMSTEWNIGMVPGVAVGRPIVRC